MNRLKELRTSHGITQDEMGKILGVQKAAVCKYETGRVSLPNSVVITLMEYFSVSSDYILGMDDVVPMLKGIHTAERKHTHALSTAMIPLVGRVHAGLPILADENITEYLPVSNVSADNRDYFFMQVEGDCMTGDHIIEGALVLIQKCSMPINNSICVVRLEDEVLLRRVQFFDNHIALIPSNPIYAPLIVDDSNVEIIGKVIEVRIRY